MVTAMDLPRRPRRGAVRNPEDLLAALWPCRRPLQDIESPRSQVPDMPSLTYHCPGCGGAAEVAEEHVGGNVTCPHCSSDFFATPPPGEEVLGAPNQQKVPFFKFSRKRVLDELLQRLTSDGEYSSADDAALLQEASRLRLSEADLIELRRASAKKRLDGILLRVKRTCHITDQDLAEIQELQVRYGGNIQLDPALQACRKLYLLEAKSELPPPITQEGFFLGKGELLYYTAASRWAQDRVCSAGVFGDRRERRPKELAAGTLYVTSKQLLFDGDSRNTSITLRRIVKVDTFSDCILVDKTTGRPDYFAMEFADVRLIAALVTFLRSRPPSSKGRPIQGEE